MKKNFTLLWLVIMFCLLGNKSFANHFLGAEIGYVSIAPNVYIAEYKAYYDCGAGAVGPGTSVQLNFTSPGCAASQVITANHVGTNKILQTYCAAVGNTCSTNAPYTLIEVTYSSTFSVSSQCPEYYLSVRDCSAGAMVNLGGSINPNGCLYLEAYINNAAAAVNYTGSPAFMEVPTLYFTLNSPATIPNLALDRTTGGLDSIGYALKPALENANTPITYSAGMSYSNPIPSSSGASMHPASGLFSFTPNVYNQGPGGFLNNAYAVVVEASGFKRINGVMTRISSTQRRIPVTIFNNAPNQNPEIINVTANGQPLPANGIVEVPVGNPLTIQFGTADANASDIVSVYDPGANFPAISATGANRPTGTITLPPATEGLYWYPIIVKDDACPVRGVTTKMVGVRVLKSLGVDKPHKANAGFMAFPNPFTNEVHFRISQVTKTQRILIFNLLGEKVDEIQLSPTHGEQNIKWQNAQRYTSGTFLAKLISEDKTIQTLKFTKLQ